MTMLSYIKLFLNLFTITFFAISVLIHFFVRPIFKSVMYREILSLMIPFVFFVQSGIGFYINYNASHSFTGRVIFDAGLMVTFALLFTYNLVKIVKSRKNSN